MFDDLFVINDDGEKTVVSVYYETCAEMCCCSFPVVSVGKNSLYVFVMRMEDAYQLLEQIIHKLADRLRSMNWLCQNHPIKILEIGYDI